MIILAGDVGGTKTNMAFFQVQNDQLVAVVEAQYPSREFANFDDVVLKFLSEHRLRADAACFGVAGPVQHGRCKAMNLPWMLDEKALQANLSIGSVKVINDLEATAYAVPILPASEFAVIQAGKEEAQGHAAVIAAGTGLGEAGLLWDGTRHRPFACEGGHSDFAPRNMQDVGLYEFLEKEFGHVAWERVLSGPGVHNLYRYCCSKPGAQPAADVVEEMKKSDPAAVVSRAALDKRCPVCVEALNLFVSLYGSEAGNLALKMMATGGLYIGGGIAPKILPALTSGLFCAAFADKGRLKTMLDLVPIRVILTNKAALVGAAQCARIHSAIRTRATF